MASPSTPRMPAAVQVGAGVSPIRILIALRSPMECQLFLAALKGSHEQLVPVACAVSKADVIQSVSKGDIDVALINADLEDGRLTGLEVISEIQVSHRNTSVVTLFDNWNDELIVHAFRAGAMGVFCRAEKKLDLLWKCISAVHQGQVWANSIQMKLLLNTLRKATPIRRVAQLSINSLAVRETQVANLIAEGSTTKDIAKSLGITEHTVNNYLFRIYNKLGISNRVELVLYMKQQEIQK